MKPRSSRHLVSCLLAPLALAVDSATACNARKTGAQPLARVVQVGPTRWNVYFPGYVTEKIGLGVHFCAAGVSVPGGGAITSIDSIAMHDVANAATILTFRWRPSAAVAAAFQRVQSGNWTGFLAETAGPTSGGRENIIAITVTVKSGTTLAQLQATLRSSVLGTDRASAGGDLLNQNRFLLTPTTVTQDTCNRNEKLLFNRAHATGATRDSSSDADTLFFMQPQDFRYGQGPMTGWRATFQDSNAATSETVQMGFVKYAADNAKPDVTATGLRTNVEYTVFGTGSGSQAVEWTMTTATKVPALRFGGIRVILPAPRSVADRLSVQTQAGTSVKIPVGLRKQWTYVLKSGAAQSYLSPGTTLLAGGLYDCPVVQIYVSSTAYGTGRELLLGPESIFPDASRGDGVGFAVQSQKHAAGFALVVAAAGYAPTPVPSPFKDVLITSVIVAGFPFLLDSNGSGRTQYVPIPSGATFATQAIFFNIKGSSLADIEFGDAQIVRAQ